MWHLSESPPEGSLGCLWEGEGTRLQVAWSLGQATGTFRPWQGTQPGLQVGRLALGQCDRALSREQSWGKDTVEMLCGLGEGQRRRTTQDSLQVGSRGEKRRLRGPDALEAGGQLVHSPGSKRLTLWNKAVSVTSSTAGGDMTLGAPGQGLQMGLVGEGAAPTARSLGSGAGGLHPPHSAVPTPHPPPARYLHLRRPAPITSPLGVSLPSCPLHNHTTCAHTHSPCT